MNDPIIAEKASFRSMSIFGHMLYLTTFIWWYFII